MRLELDGNEVDVIRELIERRLNEIKVEIHRTDSPFYRENLDKENEILHSLRTRTSEPVTQ